LVFEENAIFSQKKGKNDRKFWPQFDAFIIFQPKYVLQRGGAAGYSHFYFNKTNKVASVSTVTKSIVEAGQVAMAPVNSNGQQEPVL
jgi:hypothetical protein